ncbi:FMN-binding negative transcriptional regulator [Vibrio algivorus]|uniref:FMN-binding negative transcriptional regulator n=1 Tax=Vibrio algivorus TaxID=1667024 RepID=A0A557NXF1_9VIBR|nr:FMN-binding negative transcriptional regulator [Vibrio algivorus]TVO33079.1 FMN-binding negative transcriptional regulator [Vibrio algivorus]
MHNIKIHQQNDKEELKQVIRSYPFATLVMNTQAGLEVDHLPVILNHVNGIDVLQGHIAKANSLWKAFENDQSVTVIFHGPNCYISPNYYPTKKENGRAVPTWNYVVVHVKGTIKAIHDSEWKLNLLGNLTTQHEAEQSEPWSMADAPTQYIEKMLPAIVGVEITIESISGKWKVSQDKPAVNQQGVIDNLSKSRDIQSLEMAELVKSIQS